MKNQRGFLILQKGQSYEYASYKPGCVCLDLFGQLCEQDYDVGKERHFQVYKFSEPLPMDLSILELKKCVEAALQAKAVTAIRKGETLAYDSEGDGKATLLCVASDKRPYSEFAAEADGTPPDSPRAARRRAIEAGKAASSPSTAKNRSHFASEQRKYPIYDGRPYKLRGAPVQAFFAPFNNFIRDVREANPREDDLRRAHEMIEVICAIHADETALRKAVEPTWRAVLGRAIDSVQNNDGTNGDGATTIELLGGQHLVKTTEFEYKWQLCCGDGCGIFQGNATARKEIVGKNIDTLKEEQDACRFPKLIIHVFGNAIGVSGMVFTSDFISQEIFPMQTFGTRNPAVEVNILAKVFCAVRNANDAIRNYYLSHVVTPSTTPAWFPDVPQLPGSLQWIDRLSDGQGPTHLYQATLNSEPVVVKITERYCEDAHKHLAELGLAPTLRQYILLEESIHVVLMNRISTLDKPLHPLPQTALDDITDALKELHEKGLVFGDLRTPNILRYKKEGKERAFLVDFDWSGRAGEARYPPDMNPDIEWHKDARSFGYLQMEHDDFMLRRIIGQN